MQYDKGLETFSTNEDKCISDTMKIIDNVYVYKHPQLAGCDTRSAVVSLH